MTPAPMTAPDAAAGNRIDAVRPDAPELARLGPFAVGVRNLTLTDCGRIDVASTSDTGPIPIRDRIYTTEIWYPAADGTIPGGTYRTLLRDGTTKIVLAGRAARDAETAVGKFPLVLLSHGYPGNRFLLSHLAENLASKGYVVMSADHPDSTYEDKGRFISTLVNRPVDQAFLIDAAAHLCGDLGAVIDADRTGVVGYSMGGYGALVFGGAGLSQAAVTRTSPASLAAPQGLMERLAQDSRDLEALVDPRVKGVIAVAPWGGGRDFWDASGLGGFRKPLFVICGSEDDVVDYPSVRRIFTQTTGTDRYLLTFIGGNHNAAAPMPAPQESWAFSEKLGFAPFEHYADAVWDTVRMNNILQHFATAFFNVNLKGMEEDAAYLNLTPEAPEAFGLADDASMTPAQAAQWKGFPDRTARGLRMEHLSPD